MPLLVKLAAAYGIEFLSGPPSLEEKGGWRKALALGLAGTSMLGGPMKSHAREISSRPAVTRQADIKVGDEQGDDYWEGGTSARGSEQDWQQDINSSWAELSPAQQHATTQEQREWQKWKDPLPDDWRYWARGRRVKAVPVN